jgi:hypothetical protein
VEADTLKEMLDVLKHVDELRFLAVEKLRFEEAAFWRDTRAFFCQWLEELVNSVK